MTARGERGRLPVEDCLEELAEAIRTAGRAVLLAPTGAGKTTRVPPALLASELKDAGRIVMVEPRRIAARAAARRMAAEDGSRLGGTFGYHVRFDRRASAATRVEVVTPGILLRRLHHDPFLEDIGLVIFDEFHERSLDNDLALGLLRLLRGTIRPELRLLVMSATLDAAKLAARLGDAPLVESRGRPFPVEQLYRHRDGRRPLEQAVAEGVEELLEASAGDLLVFLPGVGEIQRTRQALLGLAERRGLDLHPLYGDLSPQEQDAALRAGPRRKVVLATNVAETSVTVEGITAVLDTGLARVLSLDPRTGLDRLRLEPISRASAEQRAGRAGRTAPGVCLRLWSRAEHDTRPARDAPEIQRIDLSGALLQLLCYGESDLDAFPWIDPPEPAGRDLALQLLERLGALRDGEVTALGRALADLPLSPRLGRLLLEGAARGEPLRAARLATLLSERSPFDRRETHGRPPAGSRAAILDRLSAIEEALAGGSEQSPWGRIRRSALRPLEKVRAKLEQALDHPSIQARLRDLGAATDSDPRAADGAIGSGSFVGRDRRQEALLRALIAAFPDRVARRRDESPDRALMVGGRGLRLERGKRLNSELWLALDLRPGTPDERVRDAAAIELDWLPEDGRSVRTEVVFDEDKERLRALRRERWLDLVLNETPARLELGPEAEAALVAAATPKIEALLPSTSSAFTRLRERCAWLAEEQPELAIPSLDRDSLVELLPWLARGARSFEDLRRADWHGMALGRLSYEQRQALDREAPAAWTLPSGRERRLEYQPGRAPVLAVKVQELFGLDEHPSLGRDRRPLCLHLLAPNGRPQQITEDLPGFWRSSWQLVRKDLRGRYPKHDWPEDPLAAKPGPGPKSRRGR